ncbi:hypothetical protein HMPREF1493_1062 [Atopobium sp. ICM42b]|nr:hypothetical protein HMPREF1493_1062 [Atopobium sp. ICM42b]
MHITPNLAVILRENRLPARLIAEQGQPHAKVTALITIS